MPSMPPIIHNQPFGPLCCELVDNIIALSFIGLTFSHRIPRSGIHLHWLALRHTSSTFRSILSNHPNPFATFRIDFGSAGWVSASLSETMTYFRRWLDLLNDVLESGVIPFPVSLHIVIYDHHLRIDTGILEVIFDILGGQHVYDALTTLRIDVHSPCTQIVTIPTIPNLTHLHIIIRGLASNCIGRQPENCWASSMSSHQIHLPHLKQLIIDTDCTRPVLFGRLPSIAQLQLRFLNLPRSVEYDTILLDLLWGTHSLFTNFRAISDNLTDVVLTLKANSLRNLGCIGLPVATKLTLHILHIYDIGRFLPMVKIDAPFLEMGCFYLSDSRCIDFEQSTFASSMRYLTVMTPCIAAPQPGIQAASPWTFQNILVYFPKLEEALIGVHGIEPISDNLSPIQWPMLKKLTLMLEPGIVKFVSRIAFPAIESARIVFPVWQMERVWLEEDHLEGNDIKDQDQDSDDSSKQGCSDSEELEADDEEYHDRHHRNIIDIMTNVGLGVALCCKQESEAFRRYFPHVPLIRCSNTQFTDQFCFDVIPPDGFDGDT